MFAAIAVSIASLGIVAFFSVRRISHARLEVSVVSRPEPPSLVRILENETELREAVSRAARYDERAAELARVRAENYAKLMVGISSRDASASRTTSLSTRHTEPDQRVPKAS